MKVGVGLGVTYCWNWLYDILPLAFPAMIAGNAPVGASALAVQVSKLVVSVDAGLKVAVIPAGSWYPDRSTTPLKLPHGTTVIVEVAEAPCAMLKGMGEMLST